MSSIKRIINRVLLKNKKRIVYPEAKDIRVLQAARAVLENNLAKISLVSSKENIPFIEKNLNKTELTKVDLHVTNNNLIDYGHQLLRDGEVDGMVSGSIAQTSEVIRSAIKHIGLKKGCSTLSSFFLMDFYNREPLFFADCAVVIEPTAKQLYDITLSTESSFRQLMPTDPKIALLSFSTKGSATHKSVNKIIRVLSDISASNPDLKIDGEMQVDAALVPSVAKRKIPDSVLGGDANILIFPNLEAGNIGYKLVERLGGASAIGPILQGLKKPSNDLSRGCSSEDIFNVTAITCLQG